MSYLKKLCVLKQLSSGFASDGKKVSGLMTFEKYGLRTTVTLSLINFAPLSDGRYIAVISDTRGSVETVELSPTGAIKKGESPLDAENGFACLICHVAMRASPVAFGKSGEAVYDVKKLCALLEQKEKGEKRQDDTAVSENNAPTNNNETTNATDNTSDCSGYDDEIVATENYYEFDDVDVENLKISEKRNESFDADKIADRKSESKSGNEKKESQIDPCENENAENLFKLESPRLCESRAEYYESVKDELCELFEKYPAEKNLERAVDGSKWVKIEFSPEKYYTVGLIYEQGAPRYICYGVPSDFKSDPPNALKGYCSYLPLSLFDLRGKGYWMMYQDADTGRCVRIESE